SSPPPPGHKSGRRPTSADDLLPPATPLHTLPGLSGHPSARPYKSHRGRLPTSSGGLVGSSGCAASSPGGPGPRYPRRWAVGMRPCGPSRTLLIQVGRRPLVTGDTASRTPCAPGGAARCFPRPRRGGGRRPGRRPSRGRLTMNDRPCRTPGIATAGTAEWRAGLQGRLGSPGRAGRPPYALAAWSGWACRATRVRLRGGAPVWGRDGRPEVDRGEPSAGGARTEGRVPRGRGEPVLGWRFVRPPGPDRTGTSGPPPNGRGTVMAHAAAGARPDGARRRRAGGARHGQRARVGAGGRGADGLAGPSRVPRRVRVGGVRPVRGGRRGSARRVRGAVAVRSGGVGGGRAAARAARLGGVVADARPVAPRDHADVVGGRGDGRASGAGRVTAPGDAGG